MAFRVEFIHADLFFFFFLQTSQARRRGVQRVQWLPPCVNGNDDKCSFHPWRSRRKVSHYGSDKTTTSAADSRGEFHLRPVAPLLCTFVDHYLTFCGLQQLVPFYNCDLNRVNSCSLVHWTTNTSIPAWTRRRVQTSPAPLLTSGTSRRYVYLLCHHCSPNATSLLLANRTKCLVVFEYVLNYESPHSWGGGAGLVVAVYTAAIWCVGVNWSIRYPRFNLVAVLCTLH